MRILDSRSSWPLVIIGHKTMEKSFVNEENLTKAVVIKMIKMEHVRKWWLMGSNDVWPQDHEVMNANWSKNF